MARDCTPWELIARHGLSVDDRHCLHDDDAWLD